LSGIAVKLFCAGSCSGGQHVQKVPQWYGETVGFWIGNNQLLVAWTA
jgi:hypothetical protein